jgi:hypothetical protein
LRYFDLDCHSMYPHSIGGLWLSRRRPVSEDKGTPGVKQAQRGLIMNVRTNREGTDHSGSTFDSSIEQGETEKKSRPLPLSELAWPLEKAMREQQKTRRASAAPAYRLPYRGKKVESNLGPTTAKLGPKPCTMT